MSIPLYEAGDTLQFTWISCTAPDAAPLFSVTDPSKTLVTSRTVATSGSLAYYTFYTMPSSTGKYRYTWTAMKTIGSSVFPFVNRGMFRVEETKIG